MAYQTLYRKYRPATFSLVYGQDTIVKTLKNVIKNNKLSHAYLFTGPRGTGKTSSAKLFAKAVNCLNSKDGDACDSCENCKTFNENSNPDIIEIDAASNNGVDEIRELKSKISLVPSMSKYKVYIIDEVHMLSIGAFNALLKTLEEPPEYVIFILATTEPQKIPSTIISRCQRFDFKSISPGYMKDCLKNIVKKEKINIDDDALQEIINNSQGAMRDAIGLLDQASSFCDEKITLNDIEELSGNISENEIRLLFSEIINKNYQLVFDKIANYSNNGKDFVLICEKLVNYIKQAILYKKHIEIDKIKDSDSKIYDNLNEEKLYIIFDFLSETLIKLKENYQKELTFEIQLIQLMDKINNVSRETLEINDLQKPQKTKENNVPRETSNTNISKIDDEKEGNVSRETYDMIQKLKQIRINNILKDATKQELQKVLLLWKSINKYLINEKYKLSAGILIDAVPVAASSDGMIVTLPLDSTVKRVEKNYDNSKDLLTKICNKNYKITYISTDYWQKIRPEYVEKIKNKELKHIEEDDVLQKIKEIDNNSVSDFKELIEMEDK